MLAGMAIFRVQRTDEPASAAECYEIGSPNWKPAVHAFAVGRKLTAPVDGRREAMGRGEQDDVGRHHQNSHRPAGRRT